MSEVVQTSIKRRFWLVREVALAVAVLLFIGGIALGFSHLRAGAERPANRPAQTTSAIPWTATPMSLTSASAELVSQSDLPLEIQHTVTAGIPLLLPKAVVTGFHVEVVDDANGFVVDYVSSGKGATVELATSQPPLPAPGSSGRRTTRDFRGGVATYQVDGTTASAARWLYWKEPGAKGLTSYSLLSDRLTESEFWQLAESLQPVGPGPVRECMASDLHAVPGPGNGASGQIFNTIWFSNHSATRCQLDGTPTVQLKAPSGHVIPLPQQNSGMPWTTVPTAPAMMAANSPDPQPGSMARRSVKRSLTFRCGTAQRSRRLRKC